MLEKRITDSRQVFNITIYTEEQYEKLFKYVKIICNRLIDNLVEFND